jgi:hypothetical protein
MEFEQNWGLCKSVANRGVPAAQVRDDMATDPDWYKEAFEGGMFPEQAAKFAGDQLL